MKVWLDDVREAPPGWLWVRSPDEAVALLEEEDVDELSLDHDLGIVDEDGREVTGYDVLLWIERQVARRGFVPPKIAVHSANPPAHERMLRAIASIEQRVAKSSDSEPAD